MDLIIEIRPDKLAIDVEKVIQESSNIRDLPFEITLN